MSSTTERLRWGILGCARITRRGLVPGMRESTTGTLEALASRDLEKARAWSQEFGVPAAYGSYEELLANPDIDVVYLPLPNEQHAPWVRAAADAGKHILCEKPLALDAAEAVELVRYCQERKVMLMEAAMWRHQPRTLGLLKLVGEGALGQLRLVRTSFSFCIEPEDWRLDPKRGGGALWDVGCYGVNAARLFTGAEPIDVQAVAHDGPTGVDMSLSALLRFPGDVLGLVDCSFEQPFRCVYELVGTEGAIEVPSAFLPSEAPTARWIWPDGTLREELIFDGRNQFACMVDAMGEALRAGHLPQAPAEDGRLQMEVLDAVKQAAAERRPTSLA